MLTKKMELTYYRYISAYVLIVALLLFCRYLRMNFYFNIVIITAWIVAGSSIGSTVRSTDCNMTYLGACYQYRVVGNHDLACEKGPEVRFCQQNCNSAKCSIQCQNHMTCKQYCAAGRCEMMRCESRNCTQSCTRSKCHMLCVGKICHQDCGVSGCKMTCSASTGSCLQTCSGGSCNMTCPVGVKVCRQTCNGGSCTMLCEAEQCERSCNGGSCLYDGKTTERALATVITIQKCNKHSSANKTSSCYQECVRLMLRLLKYVAGNSVLSDAKHL